MELGRLMIHIISEAGPLMPVMIFCAMVTLVMLGVLSFLAGGTWFDKAGFRVVGLFYGLSGYDCFRLALSWIRLMMIIYFVIRFEEIETVNFVAFLMIGILYIFDVRKPKRIPGNTLWMLILSAGLIAVNLVCGYIHTLVLFDFKVYVIYVLMGLFLCLFSFYLFIQEADVISSDRKIDPEKEYERAVREN